jgi:hypothetical protein
VSKPVKALLSQPSDAPLTIGAPFGYEYSFGDPTFLPFFNTISQCVAYQALDGHNHLLFWNSLVTLVRSLWCQSPSHQSSLIRPLSVLSASSNP